MGSGTINTSAVRSGEETNFGVSSCKITFPNPGREIARPSSSFCRLLRRPQHSTDRHQHDAGKGHVIERFLQQGHGGDGRDARNHGQHEGGPLRSDVVDGVGEEQAGDRGCEDALINALQQDE